MRHSYCIDNNKVVCESHYRGKTVRGIAKCDTTHDVFNEETGKKLAYLRCKNKISLAKLKQATKEYQLALKKHEEAERHLQNMEKYFVDSDNEYMSSTLMLTAFEQSLMD